MGVCVTCKSCGKELHAADEYAGRRVLCPACKTANQFPAAPEAPAQAGAPTEVCGLCGNDFSLDKPRVKDPSGNIYHRKCYEEERARRLAKQASAKPAATPKKSAPSAQKPARSTRQAAPSPPKPAATPQRPAPSRPQPAEELVLTDADVVEPLTPVAQPLSPVVQPLTPPVQPLAPKDDLWGELGPRAAPGLSDGSPLESLGPSYQYGPPPAKIGTGLYVLMGIGGAVPLVLLLAILIYTFTKPAERPAQPVTGAAQTAGGTTAPAAPNTPAPAPGPTSPGTPAPAPAPPASTPAPPSAPGSTVAPPPSPSSPSTPYQPTPTPGSSSPYRRSGRLRGPLYGGTIGRVRDDSRELLDQLGDPELHAPGEFRQGAADYCRGVRYHACGFLRHENPCCLGCRGERAVALAWDAKAPVEPDKDGNYPIPTPGVYKAY